MIVPWEAMMPTRQWVVRTLQTLPAVLGVAIMVLPPPSVPFIAVIITHLFHQHLPYCWGDRTQIAVLSLPGPHDMDVTNHLAFLCLETKVSRGWGTAQLRFLKVCSILLYPWHGSIKLTFYKIAISVS